MTGPQFVASFPTRSPGTTGWFDPPLTRIAAVRQPSRIRREPAMDEPSTIVGLDVHRKSIAVCVLKPYTSEPWSFQVANQPARIRKLAERLRSEARGPIRCCYEAGPCGYALQRDLRRLGVDCAVIAPSLTP